MFTGNLKKDRPTLKSLTILCPGKRLRDFGPTIEDQKKNMGKILSQAVH